MERKALPYWGAFFGSGRQSARKRGLNAAVLDFAPAMEHPRAQRAQSARQQARGRGLGDDQQGAAHLAAAELGGVEVDVRAAGKDVGDLGSQVGVVALAEVPLARNRPADARREGGDGLVIGVAVVERGP